MQERAGHDDLGFRRSGLQPRVHRFAFQGQNTEDAFMDSPQWFVADEAFQTFEAEGEFTEGEGSFGSETSASQSREILFGGVIWAVDDSQVFPASALHSGLIHDRAAPGQPGGVVLSTRPQTRVRSDWRVPMAVALGRQCWR